MKLIHVVSVSGGKDSTATLELALANRSRESVIPIFCDTGNEHESVYGYLDYLEKMCAIRIKRLKADFTHEIAAKRMFIARDMRLGRKYNRVLKVDKYGRPIYRRDKDGSVKLFPIYEQDENGDETDQIIDWTPLQKTGWDSGRKIRWTNTAKRRALSVLHPTGNPFLDLCLWKGRFPSRKAQFCTEELKRNMAVSFQLDLIDKGHSVLNWQGVRRDESQNRRNAKKIERVGPGLWIFRPIVDWTALDVFEYCAKRGLDHNPLYRQGMKRVGCMPCINVGKDELREISDRFPEHIERIDEWEDLVSRASKRQAATFIPAPGIKIQDAKEHGIHSVVEWSRTTRGGRQFDLLGGLADTTACASAYGLCE